MKQKHVSTSHNDYQSGGPLFYSPQIQRLEPENDGFQVRNLQTSRTSFQVNHVEFHGYMDVSDNSGTPKSSILIGFSIINHPFWGTPIFGNTLIVFFILTSF